MRNSKVEYFRFVLMIAIFFWHIIIHGKHLSDLQYGQNAGSIASLICLALFVPAVNCFVFLSGFYGINFSVKKIARFSFIAFSSLWIAFFLSKILQLDNSISIRYIIFHLFPISTKAWWFLTDYICIVLITPFLNVGIASLSKKKFLYILGFLVFINSFGLYLNFASTGSNFFSLLIIYLIGRFWGTFKISVKRSLLLPIYVGTTMLMILGLWILFNANMFKLMWVLLYYNNPIVVVQSISLSLLILLMKPSYSKVGVFLGANCFSIYLITEKLGKPFYQRSACYFDQSGFSFTIFFVAIIVLCLVSNKILNQLFEMMVSFFTRKRI